MRFKVRTISFTEINASAKGLTATTTTESQDKPKINEGMLVRQSSTGENSTTLPLIRRRSASMGLSPEEDLPPAMQIVGSMNDFGLGSLAWW